MAAQHNRYGRYGRPYWRIQKQVLARDDHICQLQYPGCKGVADTVDHIVPASIDPSLVRDPRNMRAACRSCNSRRGNGTRRRKQPRPNTRQW